MFKRRNNTLQAGLSIQDNALTVAIEHGKNAQPQLLEAHCLSMAPDKPAQQVFDDAKYFVGTTLSGQAYFVGTGTIPQTPRLPAALAVIPDTATVFSTPYLPVELRRHAQRRVDAINTTIKSITP